MQSPANPLYIGFCLFSSDVISNFLERSDGDLSLLKEVWVAEPSLAAAKLFSKTASWVAKQKDNSRLCADVWLESLHPHCLQMLPCAGVCPEQESSALTATQGFNFSSCEEDTCVLYLSSLENFYTEQGVFSTK